VRNFKVVTCKVVHYALNFTFYVKETLTNTERAECTDIGLLQLLCAKTLSGGSAPISHPILPFRPLPRYPGYATAPEPPIAVYDAVVIFVYHATNKVVMDTPCSNPSMVLCIDVDEGGLQYLGTRSDS